MARPWKFVAAVGVALTLLAGASAAVAASSSSGGSPDPTIHVIEHAITDTEVPVGTQGLNQPGNLLIFHNPVFDAANAKQVGSDQGDCIRIVVTTTVRTWECRWVTFLNGGAITVEGPFSELPNQQTVLAITGGTGKFQNARGQMILRARNPGETQFDFIFQLTGVAGSQD